MIFTLAVIFVSFFVGYAMKSGGLCAYIALENAVKYKNFERLFIFFGIAAWATLIILPLHWLYPNIFGLSLIHEDLFLIFLGGIIFGIGAFLNHGCFFGTFVSLVGGNINYIATLIGLSLGVAFTQIFASDSIPTNLSTSYVHTPTIGAYLWFVFMVLIAIFMAFSIKFSNNHFIKKTIGLGNLSRRSIFSMIIVGLGGALLFATLKIWTYTDVISNATSEIVGVQTITITITALLSVLAMITGGVFAAVITKQFVISKIYPLQAFGSFIGGTLMGASSMFIPGGNDGLLLHGIPSLASHALIAYLSMLVSMWILIHFFRR